MSRGTFRCTTSHGSILGPILFDIFIYDFFLWLTKSDLKHFTDNNVAVVTCNNLNDLLNTLEQEPESAVDWFKKNNAIVNLDKFQAVIMNKRRENQLTHKSKIYSNGIGKPKSLKLVGIEIDNQRSFNQHKSKLCSKAVM